MMKKTLLSTTIAVVLSFTGAISNANDSIDWEKELDAMSEKYADIDMEMGDISALLGTDESELVEEQLVEKKVEPKKEVKVVEETVAVKAEVVKEAEPVVEFVEEQVKEEPAPVKRNKEVMADETDFVFLRNIPEGTRLTVGKTYTVLPKKRFIIFSNGERVLKAPQSMENPEGRFCFIELVNSGSARILNSGKQFIITQNKTEVKEYDLKKSYGDYALRTYKTTFGVDNKNVRNITCYAAESYQKGSDAVPRPLTLKDLRTQTGGVFKVEFPAYEEI